MTNLLLFAVATIGLTNILVHGKIMDALGIRQWIKNHTNDHISSMFDCYECTGFWAGLICGAFFACPLWWTLPLYGFAGGVLAQTYTDAMYLLRSRIEYIVEDNDAQEETPEG